MKRDPTRQEMWAAHNDTRNRLDYWFPRIQDIGIPIPKTKIIPLDRHDGLRWIESKAGHEPLPASFTIEFQKAAKALGYPLFMRTDEASDKFNWSETCYVADDKQLFPNLARLIEGNETADLMGLNYANIVLREYLKPDYKFTAYHGMPVTQEYRFFAADGTYECHHPYWSEEILEARTHNPPLPSDWRDRLKKLYPGQYQGLNELSFPLLKGYAEHATKKLGDYWTIDFIYATDQFNRTGFWLTDMALGLASYHAPGCPNHIEMDLSYTEKEAPPNA